MRFDRKPEPKHSDEKPKVPRKCMFYGCECDTAVAIAVWRDASGRERSGPPSIVPSPDAFLHFVTRCAEHYLQDLYRSGQGVWSNVNQSGSPTLEDVQRINAEIRAMRDAA